MSKKPITATKSRTPRRIENLAGDRDISLDLLRAVAILIVIGVHLTHPAAPGSISGWLVTNVLSLGGVGVDLFFVLSGFLVGGLLINEHQKHGRIDVTRFLIRRGFKIYPLYFVFMAYLFVVPVAKALVGGRSPSEIILEKWEQLWPNFLFLQNYIGSNPEGHTWSLAVEEHFYIALPLLVVLLVRWERMRWITPIGTTLILVCLFLRWQYLEAGVDKTAVWTESHLRIDSLFMGVVLRYFDSQRHECGEPSGFIGLVMLIAGICCWFLALGFNWPEMVVYSLGLTVRTIGSGLILYGVWMNRTRLSRASGGVGGWPLRWLAKAGTFSYGIYVWHITAMRGIERYAGEKIRSTFGVSEASWIVEAGIYCMAALVSGWLLTRLVELPFLRIRDRLYPSRIRVVSDPGPPATRG